jgi:hypothetical protein
MAEYRLYCLDGIGKIESAEVIVAHDDAEAVGRAIEMNKPVDCEVWKGSRLVARIPSVQLRA